MSSNAVSSTGRANTLSMTVNGALETPYPTVIDFRAGHNFKKLNFDESALHLTNDANLEFLRLPNNLIGLNHLNLENLASLTGIELVNENQSYPVRDKLLEILGSGFYLRWITCKNLPNLKTIKLTGSVVSLEIDGANALEEIDVSKCFGLERLSVQGVPQLRNVNVRGCVKLQGVSGLPEDSSVLSEVGRQITDMQNRSLLNGYIYKNMTYSDVNNVIEIINEGLKALSRSRKDPFPSYLEKRGSLFGRLGEGAYQKDFYEFSFRLMPPNMMIYSAGDRVIYECREGMIHSDNVFGGDPYMLGANSHEECLRRILAVVGAILEDHGSFTERRLLNYLSKAIKQSSYDSPPKVSVYFAKDISNENRRKYENALQEIGIKIVNSPRLTSCLHIARDVSTLSSNYDYHSGKTAKPMSEEEFVTELEAMLNIFRSNSKIW
jgi:hypothetical protein